MCSYSDIVYLSSRKVTSTCGGGIVVDSEELYLKMRDLLVLLEGFLTYGGLSVLELEAIAIGMEETCDETIISQSPQFIQYATNELDAVGIPVITPVGGLSCHIYAKDFLSHAPQKDYPAGALTAALFIIYGILWYKAWYYLKR